MSLTGRPSSPPLALTSSSQIFIATSDILPLAASGPVSAMPKPMVMGSAAFAGAPASEAAAIAAMTTARATLRRFILSAMVSSLGTRARPEQQIFANHTTSQETRAGLPVARMSEATCGDPDFAGAHPGYELCALQRHGRAHEVALAELEPAMAQDVVGGGAVEKEIRQRVREQQRLPSELARRPARKRDLDLLVLAAVDLRRLEALEEVDGLGDAILELGNARFRVGEARHLGAGKPPAGVDRMIGRRAHLAHQRKHVGRKARVEKHRRVDLLRLGVGRRFVEHRGQAGQELDEDRNRSFVHGDGHGASDDAWDAVRLAAFADGSKYFIATTTHQLICCRPREGRPATLASRGPRCGDP